MWPNSQFLVAFTEEFSNGKPHFLWSVGGWADGISGVFKVSRKNSYSGDFRFSGITKISDSEKGTHWLVSSTRVSLTNLRSCICLIL